MEKLEQNLERHKPVSYTHLDVYKRQTLTFVAPVGADDRFYHSSSSWHGVLQVLPYPAHSMSAYPLYSMNRGVSSKT